MQETRRENGLLLQLVKSLEGEINSKNKENQLLFSQYEQLANQNKQLANQNSSLMQENQQLKRNQPPKDSYKYNYAILNSPRTQKLQAQISDLTQLMARQRNETQQIRFQLDKISKQKEELNKKVHELEKCNQEESIRKSNQRIDYLQKDLWRKQKEMKELTLIMYAKDATASEIAFKQEEKNRQIDILKKEIEKLKGEKERDYKANEQKRQNQQKKRIERIQWLQIMLEEANKKSNQERNKHRDEIQRIVCKQNIQKNYQNQFNKLQSQLNEQRNHSEEKIFTLQIQINKKSKQIQQTFETIKAKSKKIQQLQQLFNKQANHIKQALKAIQILNSNRKIKSPSLLISSIQSINIQNQQSNAKQHSNPYYQNQLKQRQLKLIEINREIQDYNNQLSSARLRLVQNEQFSNHYKEEIAQSQRIKQILVSQIQRSDCKIKDIKSEIVQLQKIKQQITQGLEEKRSDLYVFDQSLQQKRLENACLLANNTSMIKQKAFLQQQLKRLKDLIQHEQSLLSNIQQNISNNQQTAKTDFQEQKKLLRNQLLQMQQSTNSFMQILQNLQQQLRNKQTINEQLQLTHQQCSIKLQFLQNSLRKIPQLQKQKEQLSKLLQKYIEQQSKSKDQINDLQAKRMNISMSSAKERQWNMESAVGEQMNGKEQIQILNAVIQQIKSEHQSSITKIQNKNIQIQELEHRLKDREDHYQQQMSALKQSIRRKDVIIQSLSLLKSKPEQKTAFISLQNISDLKNHHICDSNHRPISSIIPLENSQLHHYTQQYQDSPSQIQLQNQQLHETVQQLNYIIASLQNELIVLQNHYNSEIMQLQKTIARTNAQVIALRRSIAESNPKLAELDRLARDFCARPQASRHNTKNALKTRLNSPNPMDLTYQDDYKADLSQSMTKLSKSSHISALNTSNILPKPSSPSFQQTHQPRTNSSNPYIKQMTDQKGNLKFPSSGNWSIEQLRTILQADHN